MKKVISNVTNIRKNSTFVNDYSSAHYRHLNLTKSYTESVYRAVSVYKRHDEVSTYETIDYGKFGRVIRVMKRYDKTFDVYIANTVHVGEYIYKRVIFEGNFKNLREAVKAKYRHYKD